MIKSAVLNRCLSPLEKYLKRKDIVEICINKPNEVFIELTTGEWVSAKDKNITIENMRTLAETLATISGQQFSHKYPIYSGRIPNYDFRIQVNSGSMIESGLAVTIRIGSVGLYPLESYMDQASADLIKSMIIAGKTIMVNAGTGCGKTTFLNALIDHIPRTERIITVEDTRELIVNHPNKVHMLKSKTSTDLAALKYSDFINSITRLRPDRILLGEIDIENTMVFLNLSNSGHGGGVSTIHAETPIEAVNRLCMNAEMSGSQGSADDIKKYIYSAIDAFITLNKRIENNKRIFTAKLTLTEDLK